MIGEHKFVVDLVLASLAPCSETTEESTIVTNIHGRAKCYLFGSEQGSEIRLADKKTGPRTFFLPR